MPEKYTFYQREVVDRGLNIWYDKPDGRPEVDVIAVQGLDAKPWHTWAYHPKRPSSGTSWSKKNVKAGPMWLEDLLPKRLNNTLIASFSYVRSENLLEVSQLLLNVLLQRALGEGRRFISRPLVLIGHSLGGLVIQHALVTAILQKDFANIKDCIKGIIFLGVPFQGSDAARPGEWVARAAKAARIGRVTSDYAKLIRSLKKSNVDLLYFSRAFWENYSHLDIVCYYETMDTAYGPWKTRVVDVVSATAIRKRMIPLSTNHSGLNKFSGPHDENFKLLLPEILRMVKHGLPIPIAPDRTNFTSEDGVEPCSTVPFEYDDDFVGQENYLQKLDERLSLGPEDRRAILVGDGGCGKTKIAIEFAVQFRRENPRTWVFWVHGSSKASFELSYRIIARTAMIPGRKDSKARILDLVSRWLRKKSTQPWLMIVDKLDNVELPPPLQEPSSSDQSVTKAYLDEYIPKREYSAVLFTTRSVDTGSRLCDEGGIIKVEELSMRDAKKLLRRNLPGRKYDGYRGILAEGLDFLPLAMTQAAAAISKCNLTIEDYLERFRSLDASEPISIRTGMLSFNLVKEWEEEESDRRRLERRRRKGRRLEGRRSEGEGSKSKSPACDLLSLMSFLNCQAIPRLLLLGKDPVGFTKAMILLRSFRLVDMHKSGNFEMQLCLQDSTKICLSAEETEIFSTQARESVSEAFRVREYEDYEDLERCQQFIPHVEAIFAYHTTSSSLDHRGLSENIARFKRLVGQDREASEWARKAREHAELVPDNDRRANRWGRPTQPPRNSSSSGSSDRETHSDGSQEKHREKKLYAGNLNSSDGEPKHGLIRSRRRRSGVRLLNGTESPLTAGQALIAKRRSHRNQNNAAEENQ